MRFLQHVDCDCGKTIINKSKHDRSRYGITPYFLYKYRTKFSFSKNLNVLYRISVQYRNYPLITRSDKSHRNHSSITTTLLQKALGSSGTKSRRWAYSTRYKLRRHTMTDLIPFLLELLARPQQLAES